MGYEYEKLHVDIFGNIILLVISRPKSVLGEEDTGVY